MQPWSPNSWQTYTHYQPIHYPDQAALRDAVNALRQLPPLVTYSEINHLKQAIARAGRGEAFLLQGGDCAETFKDCRADIITNKLKILLQMSIVLLHGMRKPIVRVGRIAGQYAKPRSSDYETQNDVTLPSYRGDIINTSEFTPTSRTPNPNLLLQGYHCAAMTLNYIRALLDGGFADLHSPEQWNLNFMGNSPHCDSYQKLIHTITDGLHFFRTLESVHPHPLNTVDFFTSHEALHLHYEQALTRRLDNGLWYNLSTHLPWVGVRTAAPDSAHIEFLRGIQNPVGIKVGPTMTPACLINLIEILNPHHEEGRLLLITRLGTEHTEQKLPELIKAAHKTNTPVTWSCDPMHGNTNITETGVKTRRFDDILLEVKQTRAIHKALNSHLGGVHFELTGEDVTECIGGSQGLTVKDLNRAYHTLVDPRLNYQQSLEMAFQLSHSE